MFIFGLYVISLNVSKGLTKMKKKNLKFGDAAKSLKELALLDKIFNQIAPTLYTNSIAAKTMQLSI